MSDIPARDGHQRSLVIGLMKLIAVHSYSVTIAFRVEFLHLKENRILRARIFEKSPIFSRVPNLKVDKDYVVVGWLTENNHIIEVIDVC